MLKESDIFLNESIPYYVIYMNNNKDQIFVSKNICTQDISTFCNTVD